jgi:hypothetical protein
MKLVFRFKGRAERDVRSGQWTDRAAFVRRDPQHAFLPSSARNGIGFRCLLGVR